jgi:hypothetical protein
MNYAELVIELKKLANVPNGPFAQAASAIEAQSEMIGALIIALGMTNTHPEWDVGRKAVVREAVAKAKDMVR